MTYSHNIKRYFSISLSERKSWWITSGLIGLIIFFFVWRTTDFTLRTGFLHLIIIILMSWVVIGVFVSASKIIAIWKKYTAEYSSWINGLLIGFVISFISYGYLPVAFPGNIEVKIIERLRHGRVFPGENKTEISFILTGTIYTIILLTTIFQSIFFVTNFVVFKYGYIMGAVVVFFAMLPFPHNLGLHLFYVNRKRYYFLLALSLAFCLATITKSHYTIIIAIAVGLIGLFIGKNKQINPLERKD